MTRELGKMNLIYSNAACIIAASDSQNVMEGCFLPRPQPLGREPLEKVHINLKPQKGSQQHLFVTIWPYLSGFNETVQTGPMSTRGWCFQEREIPPRIIYFTGRRIMWECREAIAFEDEPEFRGKLHIHKAIFSSLRIFDCTDIFTDVAY